jgi:UDP-3-O-[3-hydroxymyristoyl] N-acetylglucosamine deacetylase
MELQNTLQQAFKIEGIGAHSGQTSLLKVLPAQEDHGIIFKRIDLNENNLIPALYENVIDTTLCTVIGNKAGVKVSTIEHLMAALWSCGIDNALIEINGSEVPILDGSSRLFLDLIKQCGIQEQAAPRKFIKVVKSVELVVDDKKIEIAPHDSLTIDFTIQFPHQVIGEQSYIFEETTNLFDVDISSARTFGFMKDLETLHKIGLGKGVSLENAIGISEQDGVLNKEGLRYQDEFVRHKVLDCIGDLYLAGARIKGYVKAFKAGHALNNKLLRKLLANPSAYVLINHEEQFAAA